MSILEERENKGRDQAKEECALNMLKDDLSVERVAKYSGLTVEKVEELQRKCNVTEKVQMSEVRQLDGKSKKIMTILDKREEKGFKIGFEEGFEEVMGSEQARRNRALKMLKDGLSIERVAKYTELPIEKVEELQRNI